MMRAEFNSRVLHKLRKKVARCLSLYMKLHSHIPHFIYFMSVFAFVFFFRLPAWWDHSECFFGFFFFGENLLYDIFLHCFHPVTALPVDQLSFSCVVNLFHERDLHVWHKFFFEMKRPH